MPRLTAKQARFVEEYLVDLNATQAAIRAGYSKKRAGAIGFENLKKPEIDFAIQAAKKERSVRTGVTQDRVIKELSRIAFADPRAIMSWGPDGVIMRDSKDLTDDEASIVAEVAENVTETSRSLKVKLACKLGALEKLCKHLGLYDDKMRLEHSGFGGAPLRVIFEGLDDAE